MAENLTPVQDDKLKEQQVDKLKRLQAAKLERQQANRRMKSLLKKSHEFAVLCGAEVAISIKDKKSKFYTYQSIDKPASWEEIVCLYHITKT
jgi:hypothetical protein